MCFTRRLLACVKGVPTGLPYQKAIGESIRKYRKAAKMSQECLAEKAELHPVYFGQVERGEQAVSVYALVRIAKALRVKVRDLVADV
jgi:transcriptional regulator with XRE-family HTH domain